MKQLSFIFLAFMATILMSATCGQQTVVNNGNGATDSTQTLADSVKVVVGGNNGGGRPAPPDPIAIQKTLVTQYQSGEVERCIWHGNTVYRCSKNAPDAGSEFYDDHAAKVGRCYYNTRQVDAICEEATDCKTIYRVAKNIWGKPEVKWEGEN